MFCLELRASAQHGKLFGIALLPCPELSPAMPRILPSRSATLDLNGGRGGSDGIGGDGVGGGVGLTVAAGVLIPVKVVLGDWASTSRAMTGHLQLAMSSLPPKEISCVGLMLV